MSDFITSVLHLAMLLADTQCKNEVIVPTLTFIPASNPVKYVDAEPVFIDYDNNFYIGI